MRYKDTIKGSKKILKIAKKHPEYYTDAELSYARLLKRQAKDALDKKQSQGVTVISNTLSIFAV